MIAGRNDLVELKRDGYIDQSYTGEAYAFFDCPKTITGEDLRPQSSDMVLRFARGEKNFLNKSRASKGLREIVMAGRPNVVFSQNDSRNQQERLDESERVGSIPFGYGLQARYGGTNEEAADQLVEVMRYVNAKFIPGNDSFRAIVIFEKSPGEYVFRD